MFSCNLSDVTDCGSCCGGCERCITFSRLLPITYGLRLYTFTRQSYYELYGLSYMIQSKKIIGRSTGGPLRMREHLFPLLYSFVSINLQTFADMRLGRCARPAMALEDRNTAFLVHPSHTTPTVLCVPFARFSSSIGCLSLLLLSTSISISSPSFLFDPVLPPTLPCTRVILHFTHPEAAPRTRQAERSQPAPLQLDMPLATASAAPQQTMPLPARGSA